MRECFKCRIGDNQAFLFDAISPEGVVHICRKCSFEEDLPIVKSQTISQRDVGLKTDNVSKDDENKSSVYDRLSHMSAAASDMDELQKTPELEEQEVVLKEIVNNNFEKKVIVGGKPRQDLITNFHWIIMRARRMKKLSQKQFAEAIAEPEEAVKKAEQGIILDSNDGFVRKLENFLNIKILKAQIKNISASNLSYSLGEQVKERQNDIQNLGKLAFDNIASKDLTISDLQGLKKKEKEAIFAEKDENFSKSDDLIAKEDVLENEFEFGIKQDSEIESKSENKKDELSQEDINDMIFDRD